MRNAARITLIFSLVILCSGCPLDLSWLPWHSRDYITYEFTNADANATGDPTRYSDVPGLGEDAAEGEGEGEGDGEEPREVVEPDVIRRTGNLLYVLNQYRGLSIVDLETETLLSQAPTLGYPRDLYLDGDRAFVLVGYANSVSVVDDVVQTNIASRIYVLDVANPAAASIITSFDLEGDFVDSRLVGNVLYALSTEAIWHYYVEEIDGAEVDVVEKQQSSDSWVTSLNLADPENISVTDSLSFSGVGNVIQVTPDALFVCASSWITESTDITYVDISDPNGTIAVRDTITVEGQVADRFKLDAWNGVLRVVSATGGWPARNTFVTCIDLADPDDLQILGKTEVEGADGETLYATRFDGDRGYVVTYLQVDPLFVLDLSDPANPSVVGELEVPGWSTHIEPQGDRLIALGVDDTEGRRVSVSIFDVSDPAAMSLLARKSFGEDWSSSSAFEDVKAFTILDDTLIVPFTGWDPDTGLGFERLQFISYSTDDLNARGYVDIDGQILRSFAYDGQYYGVSTEQVAVINGDNLDTPNITNTITLAEYVADFQELDSGNGVEIITRWDTGTTLVRTTNAAGIKLGVVELAMANFSDSHIYGEKVVLLGTGWDNDKSFYQVFVVDCTVPTIPVVESDLRIDVTPFNYGGCWDCLYGYPEDALMTTKSASKIFAPWYPYWNVADVSFVTGDKLSIRCHTDTPDVVLGESTTNQEAIAVVDLISGAVEHVIALSYDRITSIDAVDNLLYLGTADDAGTDANEMPITANYIAQLDPSTATIGPRVNIPGTFVQYDPSTDVLVVENMQYDLDNVQQDYYYWWDYRNVVRSLNTVIWDGGDSLTVGESVDLPASVQQLLGRGEHVFLDYYDEGYWGRSVTVDAAGALSLGAEVSLGDAYTHIIDANNAVAYFNVGGRAIAAYDFTTTPELISVTEVMEAPLHLHFGTNTAYAPLGYAGIARIPY